MEAEKSPSEPGRSATRNAENWETRPGEPIFCLHVPAGTLSPAIKRPRGATGQPDYGDRHNDRPHTAVGELQAQRLKLTG